MSGEAVREWGSEFDDVIAVVQSRTLSIEDAWAVLAAARPAIEREAKAALIEEVKRLQDQIARARMEPGWDRHAAMHGYAERAERAEAECDALAARLASVEALAEGPASDGPRPYAAMIGTGVQLVVLLDDLRAALATGADQ